MRRNELLNPVLADKLEVTLGAVLFAAVIGMTCWRFRYGISVADESYCLLLAYFPSLDAHWFVNDRSIQQTAGIIASPFVRLSAHLFGLEGIVLTVRRLHLLLSILVAIQSYRIFKAYTHRGLSLAMSAVIIAFVPTGIASLTYNTLGSLFFGLATLFAITGDYRITDGATAEILVRSTPPR